LCHLFDTWIALTPVGRVRKGGRIHVSAKIKQPQEFVADDEDASNRAENGLNFSMTGYGTSVSGKMLPGEWICFYAPEGYISLGPGGAQDVRQ
jgi:hypothetical protein